MHFLDTIKKLVSLFPWRQNVKWRKSPQSRPSPAQHWSESKFSWLFQQPMNTDKYVYVVLWVKSVLGKSSCVSKVSHRYRKKHESPENNRFGVPIHLSTNRFTFEKIFLLTSFECLNKHASDTARHSVLTSSPVNVLARKKKRKRVYRTVRARGSRAYV